MTTLAQERVCTGDGKHGYRDSGRRRGGVGLGSGAGAPRTLTQGLAPPGARHDGAGVTLWPNAGFVLAELGILDEVLELGGTPAAMYRYDAEGVAGRPGYRAAGSSDGYPTCAILRTDLQAVLLRRARGGRAGGVRPRGHGHRQRSGWPGRRALRGRRALEPGPGHRRGRTRPRWRGPCAGGNAPVYQGFVNWIGVAESSRDLVDGASIHDYWGHGERVGIVALGRRKVLGGRAGADAGAGAGSAPPRGRVAQGAPPVRALARSHRRGHRCHAASGPAPDRGARPGAAGPLASRQCAAGGRCRARTLAHVGTGRLPGAEDAWHLARCLEDPAMGSGAELEQALERFGGLRRRKPRPSRGRRGTSRESCSSRTRRLAGSATRACAPAIRCKACMRWGWGGLPLPALAKPGGHRCRQRRGTVAAVTSATRWLGGRGGLD